MNSRLIIGEEFAWACKTTGVDPIDVKSIWIADGAYKIIMRIGTEEATVFQRTHRQIMAS